MTVLGVSLDKRGSTFASAEARLALATNIAFMDAKKWKVTGSMQAKLRAWERGVQSIALHGSRSWEITVVVAQRLRRWELQVLRKLFNFRRFLNGGIL